MELIEGLKWRYATKRFNQERKIAPKEIELIKEAANLTATSYGFQPFKLLIITDDEVRRELSGAAFQQPQVREASHLLLLANYIRVTDSDVESYFRLRAKLNNQDLEQSIESMERAKRVMRSTPDEEMVNWTAKQSYIVLGTIMAAAAELKIDSSPMEGFEREKFDQILRLNEKGLTASVMVALGYRDSADPNQHFKKCRKPLDQLIEEI